MKVGVGDLVEFKYSSVSIRKGALGLVLNKEFQKTMEPGRPRAYFLYHIQTLDGRVRRFDQSYLKKVTPGLYST